MTVVQRESSNLSLNHRGNSIDDMDELVVITPPASEVTGFDYQIKPKSRTKGIWRFASHNDSTTPVESEIVRRKSNSMPSSRSLVNLSIIGQDSVTCEKPLLQLPTSRVRSRSPFELDHHRHLSEEKPRSRTPQPVRRFLARTRSISPHSSKQNAAWTLPRDAKADTDSESPWAKTMKFLGRKHPGSHFSLNIGKSNKDSQLSHSPVKGITELGEATETTGPSTTADAVQSDGVDVSNQSAGSSTVGVAGAFNEMPGDVPDGALPNNANQHLKQKIIKISEQIKIEQGTRDDNVAEYLRLSHSADKQQALRMKSVFEKKNLKSKAVIAQLQKKLENYHKRLKELDSSNGKTPGGKLGFKDVQAKLTDGVASSVQGFTKLVKTANKKFPSLDNISSLKDDENFHATEDMERSNSMENVSATTSESGEISADHQSSHSLPPRPSSPQPGFAQFREQITTLQQQLDKLTELEAQQKRMEEDLQSFKAGVMQNIVRFQERFEQTKERCSINSIQIQDLTELHRREIGDVKQDLSSLEEKLEYHAQERARDMQEELEACQTRISKMEVQQQHQHQQLITMEGVENATAKALVGKLINLLLSVLAVILVFVSTVSSILAPFVRNQTRILATCICVLLLAVLYRNWTPVMSIFSESWSWWR